MSKRKLRQARLCPYCDTPAEPVRGRYRNGRRCLVCPDCGAPRN